MKLIILSILLVLGFNINAQVSANKTDDFARITLVTFIPQQIDKMPDASRSILSNKLSQIVTQSGLGGRSENQRFIITANVNVVSKDITPTSPPMQAIKLEVTLYIGDGVDGTKFSNTSIVLVGVGSNETQAYNQALNKINVKSAGFQEFIENGKNKIIEYYYSKCDFILKEAETLASKNEFDYAIVKLLNVPEVCKFCFDKCMDKVTEIYKAKMERECQNKISQANSFKAQEKYNEAANELVGVLPDLSCYSEANKLMIEINNHKCEVLIGQAKGFWAAKDIDATALALSNISADSKCFLDATKLADEVKEWVKEKDHRDWDFEFKKQQDKSDIRKLSIQAAKEIGIENSKNQPKSVTYNIKGWW